MPSWDMITSIWLSFLQSYGRYALPALVVLLAIWVALRMGRKRDESDQLSVLEKGRLRKGRDLTETITIAEAECGVLREMIVLFSKGLATPAPDFGGNQPDPDQAWLETWTEYDQTAARLPDPLGPQVREIVEPLRRNWMLLPPSSRAPELRRVFYRLRDILEQEEEVLKRLKNLRAVQESKTAQPS